MRDRQVDVPGERTRRVVLASAGAVGASALLSACGYDTSQLRDKYASGAEGGAAPAGGAAPPAGAPAQAPAQQSAAAAPPAQPPAQAPGGGAAPNAFAATSDIPVGGGKIFADDKVVVVQPTAGTFKAYDTTCTHAGCAVTTVENGTITCPCHGAAFAVADGSVQGGPAPSGLQEVGISVDGESIVLA